MNSTAVRLLFCVAVAIVGAALADPLVECASNAGLFGPGHFTDHSYIDVLPALCVGGAFILLQLLLRIRTAFQAASQRMFSHGLRAAGDAVSPPCAFRLFPIVFALQIALLYGMETSEQLVVYGHTLGGTVWLGGPVLVSLSLHALLCLGVTVAASRALQSIARAVVRILREFTILPAQGAAPLFGAVCGLPVTHQPAPIHCRIGKRAPPLLIRRLA